jgi:hypothetical protein
MLPAVAWARKHDVRALDALVRRVLDDGVSTAAACRELAAGTMPGWQGPADVPAEYARTLVAAERRRRQLAERLETDAAGVLEDGARRLAALAAAGVDRLERRGRRKGERQADATEIAAASRAIREAASALQAARGVRPRGVTGAAPAPLEQPAGLVDQLAAGA